MKIELSKISEGLTNHLFPPSEIKGLIESVAKERLSICKDCPFNSTPGKIKSWSRCNACGCFLRLKTKCLSCNCGIEVHNQENPDDLRPLKWIAKTSREENEKIQEYAKQDDST